MLSTLIGALGLTGLVNTVIGSVVPGLGSVLENVGGIVFLLGANLTTIVLDLLHA